jgi:pimeloyl-ACP methyl ester carboxylesterase
MQNYKFFIILCVSIFMSSTMYAGDIISSDHYIKYNDQKIYLKEKKTSKKDFKGTIMLLSPLSIPAIPAFDIPKYSLMDSLAEKGYDVWAIDFIGEGKSSYPKLMDEFDTPIGFYPSQKGIYPLQAKQAVKQLDEAVDFFLEKTKQKSIDLLGWSWGSVVAAMYSIDYSAKVKHLVLYGSMYSSHLKKSLEPLFIKPFAGKDGEFSKNLPAFQNVPWKMVENHWKLMLKIPWKKIAGHGEMMIGENKDIVRNSVINEVGDTYVKIDPSPNPHVRNSLRRPMGPMKDLYSIWNGHPIYDIKKLKTPTLVIYGDQDFFADKNLYKKLDNVDIKKEVVLNKATHWLIYEKTRKQFIDEVLKFLAK